MSVFLNQLKTKIECCEFQPPKGFVNMLDKVEIRKDPYGVVLVIGAWNYPLQLALVPFMGAVAAGNCVILKPSEVSQATCKLIAELVPRYMDTVTIKNILSCSK